MAFVSTFSFLGEGTFLYSCMHSTASKLSTVSEYWLKMLSEIESSIKPLAGKWSTKEIIDHLIDSAQNNIRRLLLTIKDNPEITYRQDSISRIPRY
jgi:hypothetical protein